ncbi:hypothetical protein [Tautonia sociabilis]|uniref:Sulfotransferase family protein n=1 Tax=Tautonia sociabilis TaxID=2080755 RepID=A0A432MS37_9BACT|nr:hypothetical protein [Tautonia sociabilis]RUL89785.1 hypothetical protein TsocGM_01070 [Tautonia sociabilis]
MQDLLSPSHPLLFMHLPKTAGGSILAVVESSFQPPDLYLFYHDDPSRAADEIAEAGPARLIYGHFVYGLHQTLDVPPRYCCFLRNPVDRTISHFYHLKTADPGPYGDLARGFDSVGDFVERSGYWAASNLMCRMITGLGDGRVPPDDLLAGWAKTLLRDHFPIFGISEFLPLSLEVLRRTIGLSLDSFPVVNKGSYRLRELSQRDIDLVVSANQADLDLYGFAVRRFLDTILPETMCGGPAGMANTLTAVSPASFEPLSCPIRVGSGSGESALPG